jgi:hypothetical protein
VLADEFDVDHETVERAARDLLSATGPAERERAEERLRLSRRDAQLVPLERDLKALLTAWFDIGFLELRRITWGSSFSLLERLAASEAVRAVADWDDLKDRLDAGRRLFAFFHPHMPDEPLIFVEGALVRGLPRRIESLIDKPLPPTIRAGPTPPSSIPSRGHSPVLRASASAGSSSSRWSMRCRPSSRA